MSFEEINNGDYELDPSAESTYLSFDKVNRNFDKTVEKVEGKDLSDENFTIAEKTKLLGIEVGATRDQTGEEIKALYEAEPDTNVFSDFERDKLANIEDGATADQGPTEIMNLYESNPNTNKFTDTYKAKLDSLNISGTDGTTTVSLTPSYFKSMYESNANTNEFSDAEQSKLLSIESGAQVNQTDAEIKIQYEANADTNTFTDLEKAKLLGIEDGAQANQSDAEIKIQYETNADTNAFTDSHKAKLEGLIIESELDDTSTNLIENRSIAIALDTKANKSEVVLATDLASDPGTGQGTLVHWNNVFGVQSLGTFKWLPEVATIAERDTIDTTGFTGNEAVYVQDTGSGSGAQYIWVDDEVNPLNSQWVLFSNNNIGPMSDGDIKIAYENNADTNAFTDAEKAKLATVQANAEPNRTAAEIKTDYESNADTNAFTDAEKSKLANVVEPVQLYTSVDADTAIANCDITIHTNQNKGNINLENGKYVAFAVNMFAGSTLRFFAQSPASEIEITYFRPDGVQLGVETGSSTDREDVVLVAPYSGIVYMVVRDVIATSDVTINVGLSIDATAP